MKSLSKCDYAKMRTTWLCVNATEVRQEYLKQRLLFAARDFNLSYQSGASNPCSCRNLFTQSGVTNIFLKLNSLDFSWRTTTTILRLSVHDLLTLSRRWILMKISKRQFLHGQLTAISNEKTFLQYLPVILKKYW